MDWLDWIVDGVSDYFGWGTGSGSSTGGFWDALLSEDVLAAAMGGGLGMMGTLLRPDPQMAYQNTQAGHEADIAAAQALADANNAAALERAEIQAAAMKEAAAMAAEATKRRGLMDLSGNIAAIKEKGLADRIALRMAGQQGNIALENQTQGNIANTKLATGRMAQQGFGNSANVLAAFRR